MTGDQDDILSRLKLALPRRWFDGDTPVLNAVLSGLANAWAFLYSFLVYVKLQTRIKTATDGWLDMIAGDFFGDTFQRAGRGDEAFRKAIVVNLFRERGTREGMRSVLFDLTGFEPVIFEPHRLADGMALGVTSYLDAVPLAAIGTLPFQCFIDVTRIPGSGIPTVAGLGSNYFGLGQSPVAALINLNQMVESVTNQEIYDAINRTKPAATVVWTRIHP